MPKLTVAIPTYNRREFLGNCLTSLQNQTFRDFEVVVFDNKSTNYDVKDFLEGFKGIPITLVQNEKNLGGLGNFQKIFATKFNTELVIVFHDDNTMHPKLLEREVRVLDEHPEAVWVGTGLQFAEANEDLFKFVPLPEKPDLIFCDRAQLTRLVLKNFHLSFDTAMYRTVNLRDIGPYAVKFINWLDRPYLIDLIGSGRAAILKEPLVNYRQHAGQISKDDVSTDLNNMMAFVSYYRDNLPKPLSQGDAKLFKQWATNNSLLSAANFSKNLDGYFKLLKMFKDKGFFSIAYITPRSLWYFFNSVKKLL
jgi:glycosyltransferase involved in cell wall biosynthesis